MNKWVAERRLIAEVIATGERKTFTIRIGTPYWLPDDDFASCPMEMDGLLDQVADAKGIDLIQALHLASDIDAILKQLAIKYKFYWASGEDYFDEE